MSNAQPSVQSPRIVPLQKVGIYLIVLANALTWIPLIVLERSKHYQEDPFYLYGILAGLIVAFGIVFNVAGLIRAVRDRSSKSPALLGIVAGLITTVAIVIAFLFRVFQLFNL